ncbi:MAG: hypothetical protein JWP89_3256 [Schlesneria sp.]|nr:hypothetical protein [Schlesneria sp.]
MSAGSFREGVVDCLTERQAGPAAEIGERDGHDRFLRPVRVHASFDWFNGLLVFVADDHRELDQLWLDDLSVMAHAPALFTVESTDAGVKLAPLAKLERAEGDVATTGGVPAQQVLEV